MSFLSHRLAEAANNITNLNEAGTRVSGQAIHWWQVINNHCGYTQPMSPMEVEKKTGVKPVYNKAMGKGMTEFVMKVSDGKTGPILHIVIYQEQDGNTKGWDVAVHSSGQAQSANIPAAKAKMKQMGMPCNGVKPKTSKEIMSGGVQRGEGVESGEGVTEITESTIEFMLDKKVVLKKTMKDGEARRAGDKWTKSGILPFQFNKERAEKYRIPWKTELVDGGVQWGPGYKKGQKRDAVIGAKKSFEGVEHGEGVTEGALNNLKVPAGVSLPKIIGGTQEWRGVDRNTNTKQSVVTLSAEIKKIAGAVGNPDAKTIDMIAKALIAHAKEKLGKKESVDEARTNNTGTPTPVRLGKGRPAGAMTPAALFMHKFGQLENDNAHGAAALLLAKFMGNSKAVKCIELVNKIHEIEGSIPYPVQQYRDQWSERLWGDFDKKYPKERFQ